MPEMTPVADVAVSATDRSREIAAAIEDQRMGARILEVQGRESRIDREEKWGKSVSKAEQCQWSFKQRHDLSIASDAVLSDQGEIA
jgi:hypothetical protein